MATQVKYAQSNAVVTTGWTNPGYAYSDDTNYATSTPSKSSSIVTDFYNFGLSIPTGSTINSITFEMIYFSSTTTSTNATISLQTMYGASSRGIPITGNMSLNEQNPSSTNAGTWTVAELNDNTYNGLRLRLTGSRSSSNASITWSCDLVKITVDYTPQAIIKVINEFIEINETIPKLKSIKLVINDLLGVNDITLNKRNLFKVINECEGLNESLTTQKFITKIINDIEGLIEYRQRLLPPKDYKISISETLGLNDELRNICAGIAINILSERGKYVIGSNNLDEFGRFVNNNLNYRGQIIFGNQETAPVINIISYTKTKISNINGMDVSTIIFKADRDCDQWEARAGGIGQGQGLLVGSGTEIVANANIQFDILDEELTQGDLTYRITIYGHNSQGWSSY